MRMKDVVAVLAGVVVGMSGVFVAAGEARASSGAQAVLWPDRPSDCPSRICTEGGWVVTGPTRKAVLVGVDKWRMGAPKKVAIDKCVGARTGVTRSQCDDMGFQAVAQRMTENPGRMRAYVKAHPKSRAAASGWVQGQYWVTG